MRDVAEDGRNSRYADDTALLSKTESGLENLVEEMKERSKEICT